jgi:hypothetical protein
MTRNFTIEIEKLQSLVEDNSWAKGFLDSLHSQINNSRRSLSKRQIEVLDKIKGEYTAEAVAARAKWQDEYQNHHRANAIVVATYYSHTGYFKDPTHSILNDDNYVPSQHLFNKMCKNKYAVKVLSAWHAPPKYPAGTAVMSRAGQSWALRDGGVVISVNEPITSASKGCKRYKILPYGAPRPVTCEEKHIKLFRKKKK